MYQVALQPDDFMEEEEEREDTYMFRYVYCFSFLHLLFLFGAFVKNLIIFIRFFYNETTKKNEHVKAPEVLFNAHLLASYPNLPFPPEGITTNSVVDFVYETVMACEESKRNELFNSLLLCGGLVEIKGFTQRFEREMKQKRQDMKVIQHQSPANTVAEGASLFASSSLFSPLCINRIDYLATLKPEHRMNISETQVVGDLIAKFQHTTV